MDIIVCFNPEIEYQSWIKIVTEITMKFKKVLKKNTVILLNAS